MMTCDMNDSMRSTVKQCISHGNDVSIEPKQNVNIKDVKPRGN